MSPVLWTAINMRMPIAFRGSGKLPNRDDLSDTHLQGVCACDFDTLLD
jgi:hypothetical protein